MWDDAHEKATLLVIYNIKQTFLQQILSQMPNISPLDGIENLVILKTDSVKIKITRFIQVLIFIEMVPA